MIKQNQKLRRTLLDAQVQRCPSSAVMLSVMCLCDCVRVWRGSGGVSACCVQEIALLVLISTHFICNHLSLKCTQIIVYNIFLGLANRNFAVCMAGRKRSCCSGGIWFPSGLLFVLILHSLLVAGINEMKIRSDSAQFLCTQHTPCHAHTHTHTHTTHTHPVMHTYTHTHIHTTHAHNTHTHTHTLPADSLRPFPYYEVQDVLSDRCGMMTKELMCPKNTKYVWTFSVSHSQNILGSILVICMCIICARCTYMRAYILMYVCMHAFIHENVYISHTTNMIVGLRSVSSLVSVTTWFFGYSLTHFYRFSTRKIIVGCTFVVWWCSRWTWRGPISVIEFQITCGYHRVQSLYFLGSLSVW